LILQFLQWGESNNKLLLSAIVKLDVDSFRAESASGFGDDSCSEDAMLDAIADGECPGGA